MRWLLLLLLVTTLAPPALGPESGEIPESSYQHVLATDVVVDRPTVDELTRAEAAVELFTNHGLEFESLVISFYDDPASCNGHDGLFSVRSTPWRVSVCSDLPYVLTHELAHAWIRANVSDELRADYQVLRGFEVWLSAAVSWNERAGEDAAFVMQQVLQVLPKLQSRHVSHTWLGRIEAFELLTGLVREPQPTQIADHS